MIFKASSAEIKILSFLKSKGRQADKASLANAVPDASVLKNALEGCIAKDFVKEEDDKITLKEKGEKQI